MSDFSLDKGKTWKGVLASIGAAAKYVIAPIIIIKVIASFIGEYIGDYLEAARNAVLIIGIPLIVISFFKGFYPKGSQSRLIFAVVATALVCLWIWFIFKGGVFEITVDQVTLTADYSLLILLFILVVALHGVFYIGEYMSYRKEFLSGGMKEKGKEEEIRDKGKGTVEESQSESMSPTPEADTSVKNAEGERKE
ncbi:MAG: hypothetical protein QHH00_07445 [Methanomassiliicoccales archaeon]|nr:hypothetical protein [Methanomassiliicoccales archaeon]